jgi:hypothetical protein
MSSGVKLPGSVTCEECAAVPSCTSSSPSLDPSGLIVAPDRWLGSGGPEDVHEGRQGAAGRIEVLLSCTDQKRSFHVVDQLVRRVHQTSSLVGQPDELRTAVAWVGYPTHESLLLELVDDFSDRLLRYGGPFGEVGCSGPAFDIDVRQDRRVSTGDVEPPLLQALSDGSVGGAVGLLDES